MSLEPVLRKISKGLPNYLHFRTHPTFLVILNPFRLFLRPLTQAWTKLYWGTGHTVIVYIRNSEGQFLIFLAAGVVPNREL